MIEHAQGIPRDNKQWEAEHGGQVGRVMLVGKRAAQPTGAFDEQSYLQRSTPRGKRSVWSQINVGNVARLIEEGRMTEHGLREVERAKADGRWDRAYASGKNMTLPDDLLSAVEAEPKAKKMLAKLSAQNRFALAFRLHNLKTEAGRRKKIAAFVEMLRKGETIYPQRGE